MVIAFLPRSKCLLISWLQSPSAVILEFKKIKSVIVSIVYSSICYEVIVLYAMIFIFWMLNFKAAFSLSFFTFMKRLFSSSSISAIRCHLYIWGYWYFSWQSWFQLVYDHRIVSILTFRHGNLDMGILLSLYASVIHQVKKCILYTEYFILFQEIKMSVFCFSVCKGLCIHISLLKQLKYISWTSK